MSSATKLHWATTVIGKPWRPGMRGPDAFYCWGLVQWVFKTQKDLDFPDAQLPTYGDNAEVIREVARKVNFRPAALPAQEFDIVVMRTPTRRRHVAVVIKANGTLGVLHADGNMTPLGPTGQVVFERLPDALVGSWKDFELWRAQ